MALATQKKGAAARRRVPKPRWGGKWLKSLIGLVESGKLADGRWHEVCEYGPTSGYQVAAKLNMGSILPDGRYEFGTDISDDGTSVLIVRKIA